MICSKHSTYKAQRKPRAKCPACETGWRRKQYLKQAETLVDQLNAVVKAARKDTVLIVPEVDRRPAFPKFALGSLMPEHGGHNFRLGRDIVDQLYAAMASHG